MSGSPAFTYNSSKEFGKMKICGLYVGGPHCQYSISALVLRSKLLETVAISCE